MSAPLDSLTKYERGFFDAIVRRVAITAENEPHVGDGYASYYDTINASNGEFLTISIQVWSGKRERKTK